ncbi:MAG: Hpt domain-containing protein [Phycisphaeraceae bacterium]|nr:Hpt domain-containing protein [Phycisphaeraceae bacterium]
MTDPTPNARARTGDPAPRGSGASPSEPPLRSQFADDPDMSEIIALFVDEMPQRLADMRKRWESQQLDELKRLAHQLRGAGGGYGFPAIGAAAGRLEEILKAMVDRGADVSAAQVQAEFAALIDLCQTAVRR